MTIKLGSSVDDLPTYYIASANRKRKSFQKTNPKCVQRFEYILLYIIGILCTQVTDMFSLLEANSEFIEEINILKTPRLFRLCRQ